MKGSSKRKSALARANELVRCAVVRTTQCDGCPSICVHISADVMLCGGGGDFLDVARTSASVTVSSR